MPISYASVIGFAFIRNNLSHRPRKNRRQGGGDVVGNGFSEGRRRRGQERARRDAGGPEFLRGGSRVVGANLGGQPIAGMGDAVLQRTGLSPRRIVRAAGRGGEFGADRLGKTGGGGFNRGSEGFGDRNGGEGGSDLAWGLEHV
jgi:hypothetical protein